jgi:hypothetical protein
MTVSLCVLSNAHQYGGVGYPATSDGAGSLSKITHPLAMAHASALESSLPRQFCPDYIIATPGYDFRERQEAEILMLRH